jgi:hypothetical protein
MPEDEPAAADGLLSRRSANSNSGPEVEDTLAHLGGSRAVLRKICGQLVGCMVIVFVVDVVFSYALGVPFDKFTLVAIAKVFGGVVCIGCVRLHRPEMNVVSYAIFCAAVFGAITGSWHGAFGGALGAVVGGRCGQPIEPTTELTDVNLDTPPLTPPDHSQYGEPPAYAAVQTEEDTPLQKV